jgi:hypothetical protein
MAKLVLPRVQAMVLCDSLRESDEEADVFNLTGVRAVLEVASFPAQYPRLCVFLHMSGHQGEALCHVEVNRIGVDQVIFRAATKTVSFKHPTTVVPVEFRVPRCVFPAPGVYFVLVFNEDKLIGERPLQLRQEG